MEAKRKDDPAHLLRCHCLSVFLSLILLSSQPRGAGRASVPFSFTESFHFFQKQTVLRHKRNHRALSVTLLADRVQVLGRRERERNGGMEVRRKRERKTDQSPRPPSSLPTPMPLPFGLPFPNPPLLPAPRSGASLPLLSLSLNPFSAFRNKQSCVANAISAPYRSR